MTYYFGKSFLPAVLWEKRERESACYEEEEKGEGTVGYDQFQDSFGML